MGAGGLRRFFKKESPTTEEEIKQLVDEDDGELEITQREMINNIFEFDDIAAEDIMTHRTEIIAVEDNKTLRDVVDAAIENGYSRIPVYHSDIDDIVGIIYVKDLLKFIGAPLKDGEKLKDYIREPLFVPETIPCGRLFEKMTETHIQLAVVVDEYGGTAGLVTLEDIIEELVGDIEDEYDEEENSVEKTGENTYIFDGTTDIDDAGEILSIEFPDGDYDTIAGFLISRLGFVPSQNDADARVVFASTEFTVVKADERRIEKIKAVRLNREVEHENTYD